MNLEQRINTDIKTAMKAKDSIRLRALRAVKSAILLAKTDGSRQEIDEEKEIQILQKLVKQRRDSLQIYEEQNRPDLASKEKEEIEVIQIYLPQQLSPEELDQKIRDIISELGAKSMKDMGRVMGRARKDLAGKAEGKAIAETVKRLLS